MWIGKSNVHDSSASDHHCWISISISDQKLRPSGQSRQRGWRCIISHTLLRMVRWCIRLTRLTLVCEVIWYRLVQVRQNLKKKRLSGWRPAIAFLYLFLFHSLLRLTSFLSQNKNNHKRCRMFSCGKWEEVIMTVSRCCSQMSVSLIKVFSNC